MVDSRQTKRRGLPPLTDSQKRRLKLLEPALRDAVKLGKYERAKLLTHEIQDVLRPTGHETRLMQAKNWLFEAALESGNIEFAISGFNGIRIKASSTTRLYLEATALLAVCYLRKKDLKSAQPLIEEALGNLRNISSERQRRKLHANLVKRFEEEGMLAALSQDASPFSLLDADDIPSGDNLLTALVDLATVAEHGSADGPGRDSGRPRRRRRASLRTNA